MKQYRLLNNIIGWVAFFVAAYTYLSTVEPTASFWDCPEYITCATTGEVGHPPGNTFFNLTGRFFVNFAGGDMSLAALWVNRMSAIFSALTILFLFWTITALTKKLVCPDDRKMNAAKMISILGAGLTGALVYTWSDTFWFSAVEAEVYAFSSMMTALTFWLIMKWENKSAGVEGDRYIILLAYFIGLSIGVHLLNLLSIPAIVLIYYFKKTPHAKLKGTLGALVVAVLIIAFILFGLIPGFSKLAGQVELFAVNSLGLSYNTGTAFYFFFVLALLSFGIWKAYRKETPRNTLLIILSACIILSGVPFVGDSWMLGILIALAFVALIIWARNRINARLSTNVLLSLLCILLGYSTFAQIIIRSTAQLPMNQNDPEEIFSFIKYLNREQYGESPLFSGQTFASDVMRDGSGQVVSKEGAPIYARVAKQSTSEPDKYIVADHKRKYEYNYTVLFPRMYSQQGNHIEGYKAWSNFKGQKVKAKDGKTITVPTFGENLRYFFSYQLNFMYWRYFMWNFAGRQSDIQTHGAIDQGNWITGIKFIDEILVGPQDNLPAQMANNKGRNVYYMLPLLLGLIGLLWQAFNGEKGIQGFWVVFFLFFMTGIAIVIYLNQTPYQPRERDYAYAGSFYAFSIWVGMGVAALIDSIGKLMKKESVAVSVAMSLLCLFVPFQMVGQTWDDHDRSGRYTARDFGKNYLTSLEKDAIIFTNGDNDTFPLWYNQDVEGYRRDVRVCNLSYLQTDWYISQMKSQAYESDPLPIALKPYQYSNGKLDYAHLIERIQGEQPLSAAMQFLYSDDIRYKTVGGYSGTIDHLPAKKFYIDIDSAAVAASPVVDIDKGDVISKRMHIDLSGKNYVTKNEIAILAMLDGINRDGWKRPIYFATTVGPEMYMSLNRYFRLTGLAYQIVPLENGGTQTCDIDSTYNCMMNKFVWGNIQDSTIYLDENNQRMCRTQRMMFGTLVDQLVRHGDYDRAVKASDYCCEVIPDYNIPYDYTSLTFAQAYYLAGFEEKGNAIVKRVLEYASDYMQWAVRLNKTQAGTVNRNIREQVLTMRDALGMAQRYRQNKIVEEYDPLFNSYGDFAVKSGALK